MVQITARGSGGILGARNSGKTPSQAIDRAHARRMAPELARSYGKHSERGEKWEAWSTPRNVADFDAEVSNFRRK